LEVVQEKFDHPDLDISSANPGHAVLKYINGRDVQRKNVVNNVDKLSLWAP